MELWTQDLAGTGQAFSWILEKVGFTERPTGGWENGRIWDSPDGYYIVLEESPAVTGELDRMRAGMNHLALSVASRQILDEIRAEAPRHGFRELFADKYPNAGGSKHVALYLENLEGFEIELVVLENQ